MESTRPFKRVEEVCFYVLYSTRREPPTVRVNIYARDPKPNDRRDLL